MLLDPRARQRGLYATSRIEADSRAGRWRDPAGIFRALVLELWLDAFDRSPTGGPSGSRRPALLPARQLDR